MPTYDYVCHHCGHRFEVIHGVHADGPSHCPVCHKGDVRKAISAPSIVFKGSGWAKKDRSSTSRPSPASGSSDSPPSGSSDSPAGGPSESSAAKGSTDGGSAGSDGSRSGSAKSPKADGAGSTTPAGGTAAD